MLPNGWNYYPLNELGLVERGKFSARPRNDPKYFGGNIPFVQTGDIGSAETFLTKFSQTLNNDGLEVSKLFPKNTILITIAANIGETAITTFDTACPDSIVAIQPYEKMADYFWLEKVLVTYKTYLDSIATQNAQKNINLQVLKPLLIKTPPISEQKKISEILVCWDNVIAATQKSILNSQLQKKYFIQQLLTGGNRLQGFSEEWEEVSLADVCEFKKGKGLSKGSIKDKGKYKCILYGELYTKYNEVIKQVISRTDSTDSISSVSGDILIPCSTTTSGIDLANAVSLKESGVLLGGDINILRPNKKYICSEFLAYLLTHIKKYEIASLAQGITIIHLYGKDLKPINIQIPSKKEQEKISSVLASAEQEIEALYRKLELLKEEKKALMQQLLTGKKRVKVA